MKIHASLKTDTYRVREKCHLEIVVTLDSPLSAGDNIQFQFPNSWSLVSGPSHTRDFQTSNPEGGHYLSVARADGLPCTFRLSLKAHNLDYPEGPSRHGRLITAELVEGMIPPQTPILLRYANTYAPYVAETDQVWLQVNGTRPEELPILKVTSAEHQCFRIFAPSCIKPGQAFEVLIVSLDPFENASCTEFRGERLLLNDASVVADKLDFRGSLRVRTQIDKPGIHRFSFRDVRSNAVKVAPDAQPLYWGDLHIHSKLSHDAQGNDPYSYARQVSGLDFAGVADHWQSLGKGGYRILLQWAEEAMMPGEFVTMPCDERNPPELLGHHNLYFHDIDSMKKYLALHEKDSQETPSSFHLLQDADPDELLLIPHHTGIAFGDLRPGQNGNAIDWDIIADRGLRPVMEIYSHHGQSEAYNPQHLLAYESNRMRNPERRTNTSVPGPYYAQDYWMSGKRIGVIASSDEHSGQGGRRHGGIAAVLAPTLSRKDIFQALRKRRCYATTGERILLEFAVDQWQMGECGTAVPGQELNLRLNAWGTDTLLRVDILRYRFGVDHSFVPIVSISPRPESSDAAVVCQDTAECPCVYYARIVQEPLEWPAMAWSSPIWIDVQQ